MKTVPCRVHVILAREARTAVVFRKGPSKRVCTLAWDRRSDTFQVGQWFKGRIYERRCDLSPDGKHLIYFAMNGKWASAVKGSWTGISKAPYLKAIGLWANGSGWNGGGLFTSNRTYWLNECCFGQVEQITPPRLKRADHFPFHESYGGECPGVYYMRLQRDGWQLVRTERTGASIFEKPLPKGWVLEKTAHATIDHPVGKGCYYDTHRLKKADGSGTLDLPDWEWADLDRQRLVWVDAGVLYAARLNADGPCNPKALFDFNPLTFERIQAPY